MKTIYLRLLFAFVAFGFALHPLATQPLTPFPYGIQKDIVVDTAAVVSAHPLATQIGMDVLRSGGNAVDAAVAAYFALAVVYPQAGNIGGGGFMLYRSAAGETSALDFREKAPSAAYETMYQDSLGAVLPQKSRFGIFASGVPGSVHGMWEAHKKYGSQPWSQLLWPAIQLAEKGFQITAREAEQLNAEKLNFVRFCSIMPVFVNMADWTEGDWLIQKDLGQTLRRVASYGPDGFYRGVVAEKIVLEMQKQGGLITHADLQAYQSVWREPVVFDWQGLTIISMPLPSSGGLLLHQMLGMLSEIMPVDSGFHSAAMVHAMAEVERRAYADRAMHMGDPEYWVAPSEQLTEPAYLKSRIKDFDPNRATPSQNVKAGVFKGSEETTHLNVVDGRGNAVAITTTLNDAYGSRVVVTGAGFLLNNEMDDFSAKPGAANLYGAVGGKANAVAPNKRPLSSMTPTLVIRDGKLDLILGTPGGTTIPTSVFQVIVNTYLFDMPLKEAVHSGRFHHQWSPDKLFVEENALPENVVLALEALGHTVEPRSAIGRVEAIRILPGGKLNAVADNRGDDHAGGY